MDSHRASIIAISFILILVFVWAGSAYLPQGQHARTASAITLTHHTEGAMHIYTGEAPLLKPCAAFGVRGEVLDEKVRITLTTQQLPGQTTCTDTTATAPFSIALADLSADTEVSISLDGREFSAEVIEK